MITCQNLAETFKSQGLSYFAGVPDSTFKDWMSFLADNDGKGLTNRIAAIERDAVGWAAGYNIATGRIGVVYMQNSGLGNIVNPFTSLTDPEVYDIPLLFMVGWRGEPGEKDEPQHVKMGRITMSLLDVLEIEHSVLPDNIKDAEKLIARVVNEMKRTGKSHALIVKKGILEKYKRTEQAVEQIEFEMTRKDAVKIVVDAMNGDEVIVSTTGKTSRELFEDREARKEGHEKDFLMVGSMGLASSCGAEIALQKPDKKIFVFDGDGALIMSAGVLSTIGFYSPQNLYHIIFDNGSYDSTGGQQTTSSAIDFEKLALANNYKGIGVVKTETELREYVKEMKNRKGPQMLVIKVKKGARKDLGRPTSSPVENKKALMDFLGVKL